MLKKYKVDTVHLSCEMTHEFFSFCVDYCARYDMQYVIKSVGQMSRVFNCDRFRILLTETGNGQYHQATIQLHSTLCNWYGLSIIPKINQSNEIKNIRFTRIDVCVDMIGESFRLVRGKVRKKPSKSTVKAENIDNCGILETVYFKSKSFCIRIYDKAAEQKNNQIKLYPVTPEDWKRFEIQFNKDFLKRYCMRDTESKTLIKLYSHLNSLLFTFHSEYSFNPKYDKIIRNMLSGGNKLNRYQPEYDYQMVHKNAMKYVKMAMYIAANMPDTFKEIVSNEKMQHNIKEYYHNNKKLQNIINK